ncbi:hypothetical protein [Paraburkholderia fynbosensis]|nr:hypothetical protein [Paraburkholderia fynbosensis]
MRLLLVVARIAETQVIEWMFIARNNAIAMALQACKPVDCMISR